MNDTPWTREKILYGIGGLVVAAACLIIIWRTISPLISWLFGWP